MSRKRNHQARIYHSRQQFKAGPSYLLQGLLISNGYVQPNHGTDPRTHGWMNQQLATTWGRVKKKLCNAATRVMAAVS